MEQLARRPIQDLERPSFIKVGDQRGTENIGANDITPPALRLAQDNSPEVKRQDEKYIKGLIAGNFFNSSTKQVYGEGPLSLVVVNSLGHRNVEFDPEDKKVVLDFNVPDDDPRCQFTTQVVDGVEKRIKPKATTFYDYLVMLVDGDKRSVMTMSLKSTQLKKAKEFNTTLVGSKMPSWAFLFEVETRSETKKGNSFWGWKLTPVGYVPEDVYFECERVYEKFKGKAVKVADEEADDEVSDEKIPF
jgi:hypothetical protein